MKILSKEEEAAHYSTTVRGGTVGGLLGLAVGLSSAAFFNRRFIFFRSLTLPLKAFYATSIGTFSAVISADRASRGFEADLHHPGEAELRRRETEYRETQRALQTPSERAISWGRENRYPIVLTSWLGSMGGSWYLINRNKYLTLSQKIVQARVYAQGLTLLVLIATATFEIADARNQKRIGDEMVVDPSDPEGKRMVQRRQLMHHEHYRGEDMWKTMVEKEEQRLEQIHQQQHKS